MSKKLPASAVPVRLISGGKLSKKVSQSILNYRDGDGNHLNFSKHKSGYNKVLGMKRHETIYYRPEKKLWEATTGEFESEDHKIEFRIKLWCDIDDLAEATTVLKTIIKDMTNFDSCGRTFSFSESEQLGEDEIKEDTLMVLSDFVYSGTETKYRYKDTWKVSVKQTMVTLDSKITNTWTQTEITDFDTRKEHEGTQFSNKTDAKHIGVKKDRKRLYKR